MTVRFIQPRTGHRRLNWFYVFGGCLGSVLFGRPGSEKVKEEQNIGNGVRKISS